MTKDACWSRTNGDKEKTTLLKTFQVLSEKVSFVPTSFSEDIFDSDVDMWPISCFNISSVHCSGFEVKVVASDSYIRRDSGLMYRDFEVGEGDYPKDGQQVFLFLCPDS